MESMEYTPKGATLRHPRTKVEASREMWPVSKSNEWGKICSGLFEHKIGASSTSTQRFITKIQPLSEFYQGFARAVEVFPLPLIFMRIPRLDRSSVSSKHRPK